MQVDILQTVVFKAFTQIGTGVRILFCEIDVFEWAAGKGSDFNLFNAFWDIKRCQSTAFAKGQILNEFNTIRNVDGLQPGTTVKGEILDLSYPVGNGG